MSALICLNIFRNEDDRPTTAEERRDRDYVEAMLRSFEGGKRTVLTQQERDEYSRYLRGEGADPRD